MAGFAAEGRAIGAFASHAIVEFAFVRIFVAGGAGAILKMERKNFVGAAAADRPCGNRRRGQLRARLPRGNAWFCVSRW